MALHIRERQQAAAGCIIHGGLGAALGQPRVRRESLGGGRQGGWAPPTQPFLACPDLGLAVSPEPSATVRRVLGHRRRRAKEKAASTRTRASPLARWPHASVHGPAGAPGAQSVLGLAASPCVPNSWDALELGGQRSPRCDGCRGRDGEGSGRAWKGRGELESSQGEGIAGALGRRWWGAARGCWRRRAVERRRRPPIGWACVT